MSQTLGGQRFADDGSLAVISATPNSAATYLGGWAHTQDGVAYIADAGTAVPATAVRLNGKTMTPQGAVYVTTDTPSNTVSAYLSGRAFRKSDGAMHIQTGAVAATAIALGGAKHTQAGALYTGGDGFTLPLADAGAGAVNTTAFAGIGSPTFTRATTAWTKLTSGLWASVATGIARSSYIGMNTAVGAYGGYFAEGAGTQLVTPTASIRDMTDASWVKVTMTAAKTSTGIDGVANSATRLTATGATSTALQTLVAAASSRTYSAWLRRVTGSGTIVLRSGASTLDVTASLNSVTYTLVSLTSSDLNAAFGIQITTSGDAVDADFNQFEAGAFATSPMDAAGAARNGDVLTYPVAGNALGTVGTFYGEVVSEWGAITLATSVYVLDLGTNAAVCFFTTTRLVAVFDGTSQRSFGITYAGQASAKIATAWGGSATNAAMNGAIGTPAGYDGDLNAGANMSIGAFNAASSQFSGTIKNVRIWQTQLSDSDLQRLTT